MSKLTDSPDYRRTNPEAVLGCSKPWRKVLYDSPESRLGDNYTPHAYFLDAIERNKNLHKYSLAECLQCGCQASLSLSRHWLPTQSKLYITYE